MKDRLAKFIRNEQLSPSRFAEIMGIPPSSVSHLLAGRNNPSYDFISKMMMRFPKVNPDWLILGNGPIYRQPSLSGNTETTDDNRNYETGGQQISMTFAPSQSVVYSDDDTIKGDNISGYKSEKINEEAAIAGKSENSIRTEPFTAESPNKIMPKQTSSPAELQNIQEERRSTPSEITTQPANETPSLKRVKSIKQVILFYGDDSFRAYAPEESSEP